MAFSSRNNFGKPAPKRQMIVDFTGVRHDGVVLASAIPYANHVHLTPDR